MHTTNIPILVLAILAVMHTVVAMERRFADRTSRGESSSGGGQRENRRERVSRRDRDARENGVYQDESRGERATREDRRRGVYLSHPIILKSKMLTIIQRRDQPRSSEPELPSLVVQTPNGRIKVFSNEPLLEQHAETWRRYIRHENSEVGSKILVEIVDQVLEWHFTYFDHMQDIDHVIMVTAFYHHVFVCISYSVNRMRPS